MNKDYAKLKELLEEQEKFPLDFTFKFVGRHTPAFAQSVGSLQKKFPGLKETHSRESSGGKHVAKTFSFNAPDADSILDVFKAIEKLEDVLVVL